MFDIFGIVVLQFERMEAMQIEKCREYAVILYFILLMLLVCTGLYKEFNVINIVYFVVVLSCALKFMLIINKDK